MGCDDTFGSLAEFTFYMGFDYSFGIWHIGRSAQLTFYKVCDDTFGTCVPTWVQMRLFRAAVRLDF